MEIQQLREYQLENLNFSRPWYTFRYTPLEKRAYGFSTTDGYFYLDYADLDNVCTIPKSGTNQE